MNRISIVCAAFVMMLAFQGLTAGAEEPAAATVPQLSVTVWPHREIIPASMANGRPVYRFQVSVADERKRMMFAHAETLLQAGDTKPVEQGNETSGMVRGVISLDGQGRASYRAQYVKDSRVLLETAANIRLLPD